MFLPMFNKLSVGISGNKEDTSEVLRFAIRRKHLTENGFGNMLGEYVAISGENIESIFKSHVFVTRL